METIINLNQENEIYDINEKNVQGIIKSLNKKGIFTVQDYLVATNEDLPFNGKEPMYIALREILRHKYLGGDFSLDGILTSEYETEADSLNKKGFVKCARDLRSLGFKIHPLDGEGNNKDYSVNKYRGQVENTDVVKAYFKNEIVSNRLPESLINKEMINMDQVLKYFHGVEESKGIHLKDYYLKYLEKKLEKNPDFVPLETIRYVERLKEELPELIEKRNNISNAITELEPKIERLELIKDRTPSLSEEADGHLKAFKEQITKLRQEKEMIDIDIEIAQKRTGSTTEQETVGSNNSSFGRK